MDVKVVNHSQFLVTTGPTESKMLNEIAFAKQQDPEKILASLVFITIVSEHAEMKLQEIIAEHTNYWDY